MKARRAKKGFGAVMRHQREAGIPTPRPYHGMARIEPFGDTKVPSYELVEHRIRPVACGVTAAFYEFGVFSDPILDRMEHDA